METKSAAKHKSRFKEKIRIDPIQKEYIRTLKLARTDAGALDIIINAYKQKKEKKK